MHLRIYAFMHFSMRAFRPANVPRAASAACAYYEQADPRT
jgi:hypothetical protein